MRSGKKLRNDDVRVRKDPSGEWIASYKGLEGHGPGPLSAAHDLIAKAHARARASDGDKPAHGVTASDPRAG